jgi:hypothetical protein
VSDEPIVWIVAILEVITALGIAAYWATWFRLPHDEEWLPDGYIDHEAPFVYTDTLLAVVLVAAAILQVTDAGPGSAAALSTAPARPLGESLALFAAGMLAFLGILDLAYFARTGMFEKAHEGLVNAGVVTGTLTMSVILLVRFL